MARYLVVTYDFPPKNSPRAFRWGTIAEYLAKQGHQVDVVTQGTDNMHAYVQGVTVYPAKEFLLGCFRTAQGGNHIDFNQEDLAAVATDPRWKTKLKTGFTSGIKWAHDTIWQNIYWPDFATLWIFPALKTAKGLIKKHHYDALVSVSHPFSGHVIGLKLKKSFPNLYWMADMGDPFSIMKDIPLNNYKLYGNYNHRVEQDVFNLADVISVTTQETKTEYAPWLPPESFDKIKVMPPLFKPAQGSKPTVKSKDKLRLFYCGSLCKSIRNPSFLLQLFAKLAGETFNSKQLELHITGDICDTEECFAPYHDLLGKQIFLHGQQPKETVQEMMAASNVLINICNDTLYQLPSKVAEYASSGKPILNFVKSKKDASVQFFENYGNVQSINQSSGFEKSLKKLSMFLSLPLQDLTDQQIAGFLQPYLANAVCQQYADALPHEEIHEQTA